MKQPKCDQSFLNTMKGLRVGSVVFVSDYSQIWCDKASFSFITWPSITVHGKTYEKETPGFRDALCQLIDKEIIDVTEYPEEKLVIKFSEDIILETSLKDEDRVTVEAVTYQEKTGKNWTYW